MISAELLRYLDRKVIQEADLLITLLPSGVKPSKPFFTGNIKDQQLSIKET